jgi:hypothetical protein
VPLIAFIYVLETVRQGKKFLIEKRRFFSLSSVWSAIFHKIVILLQCLDPNPNPNPNFFSDSDAVKKIWIQIHYTDQHCFDSKSFCFVSGANLLSNTHFFSCVYPLYDVYNSLVPNFYCGRLHYRSILTNVLHVGGGLLVYRYIFYNTYILHYKVKNVFQIKNGRWSNRC